MFTYKEITSTVHRIETRNRGSIVKVSIKMKSKIKTISALDVIPKARKSLLTK